MKVVGGLPDGDPDDPEPADDTPDDFELPDPTVKGTFAPPGWPACGMEGLPGELGAGGGPTGVFRPARGGLTVDGAPVEPPDTPKGAGPLFGAEIDGGDPLLGAPAGGVDTAGFGVEGSLKPEDGGFTIGAGAADPLGAAGLGLMAGGRTNEPPLRDGNWKPERPELLGDDGL